MHKKLKIFLDKARAQKIEAMVGISVDLKYYNRFLKENDEDKLREKLSEAQRELELEQLKQGPNIKKGKGGVKIDNRDMSKITPLIEKKQTLEALINKIANPQTGIKMRKLQAEEMMEDIMRYVAVMDSLNKKDIDELTGIINL